MKIDDVINQRELRHVGIGLTEGEAIELRGTLESLLSDPKPRHEHISSAEYDRELTVWIIRG